MSEMKLIMEGWNKFLIELGPTPEPENITTIGELHEYFLEKDPGVLKKLAAKYGGASAKMAGVAGGLGLAASGMGPGGVIAGTAAGAIAEKIVEQLLMASIMAFANIEDGTYPAGTAASYFDLDDHLTLFLRDVETKGADIAKPSLPEKEVFSIMKKKIQDAITGSVAPDTTLADLLQSVTSSSVMDARIQAGEHSGKVKVEPMGE